MERVELQITGMSCGHCVESVRRALSEIDGVTVGDVTVGGARVTYDPLRTNARQVIGAINDQGYEARVKPS